MSCGCTNNSDPGFCGPPQVITQIVTGPQGPVGKSAYQVWLDQGNEGTELDFLDSLQGTNGLNGEIGPAGATGPKGDTGETGATGATGAAGTARPVAFFTGAQWNPNPPYSGAVTSLMDQRLLQFGAIPFPTGRYLAKLSMQIGWNAGASGANVREGTAWLEQNESVGVFEGLMEFTWARQKTGTSGYGYGTAMSFDFDQIVNLRNGWTITLKCGAAFYLIGAQLTIFAEPEYIISSPGFADGRNQRVFNIPVITP